MNKQNPHRRSPYRSDRDNGWWTTRRVICVAALLLSAVYIVAQPALEQWLGVDLPNLVEDDAAGPGDARPRSPRPAAEEPVADGTATASQDRDKTAAAAAFQLKQTGRERYESPAGLVYAMGPRGEHRIDHIMRHARDDPGRPVHGVFQGQTRDEILSLLDEAYRRVRANSPEVTRQTQGSRTEWTIDMPGVIGYVGGREGRRKDRPPTRRLRLVLEGNQVVTAYPAWPSRAR